MGQTINIFLASSITEFATERISIENFIHQISQQFEQRHNIKLQPLLCENFDDAVGLIRKQETYNDAIRSSELCFFIFFTKAGKYTQEEFQVALEQFKKTGKPKIYTYFKLLDTETPEESLTSFIHTLSQVLGHYYGTFSHIDTVKLRILMSLKLQEMDFLEIKAEDGTCLVDGTDILSLKNVMEFANNRQLSQLQQELEQVEKDYVQMKAIYEQHRSGKLFYDRYSKVAAKRQRLKEEIEQLQKMIFNVSLRMVRDEIRGEITLRQKEAYRLFELGDCEGAIAVLDEAEIDDDFLREERQEADRRLARRRKYIREYKTRIEILCAMTDYEDRFREIKTCYEKIVPYALQDRIELDAVYDYADFLHTQGEDAVPLCEKLFAIYSSSNTISPMEQVKLVSLMGLVYHDQEQSKKAEEFYRKAIKLYEQLACENPQQVNSNLALCLNNAGIFFLEQGKHEITEQYFTKALAIREALAQETPQHFLADMADSLSNLGSYYHKLRQPEKAEGYYRRALKIREKLARENPARFRHLLAVSLNNAGVFYNEQNKPGIAEEYYLQALSIRRELSQENPPRFNPTLANTLSNAADFYSTLGKSEKAEEFYLEAISLWEDLVQQNSPRFNSPLATSLFSAGVFYQKNNQFEKAEKYFHKAIAIQEDLAQKNPGRFNPILANNLNNVGVFYDSRKQSEKAADYYLRAIDLYEELTRNDLQHFAPSLAASYFNYVIFERSHLSQVELAVQYCKKALDLAQQYPDHPDCKYIISTLKT